MLLQRQLWFIEWFHTFGERYDERTAELIREGQAVSTELLEACRKGCGALRTEVLTEMKKRRLSALLAPAAVGPAPCGLGRTGDPVMNLPWTHAGLPVVNLPSGKSRDRLPMGLQLVGLWMGDEELLEVVKRIEGILDYHS